MDSHFKIVESYDLYGLEDYVNSYLKRGYTLWGNIIVTSKVIDDGQSHRRQQDRRVDITVHKYAQCMFKETSNE